MEDGPFRGAVFLHTYCVNCFVVGTGRCGTSSFYQAAKHVRDWTAGHESAAGYIGPPVYPDRHIEVDAQLVYRIPELLQLYPEARWVHLIRERDSCVRSLAVESYQVMRAFAYQWHQVQMDFGVWEAAESFYDRTNELISTLLPDAFVIQLEELAEKWEDFTDWLEVKCDAGVALEFGRVYNPGTARGRDSYVELT